MTQPVKLVVTVPEANGDMLRDVIGAASGGTIGNYTHTSFTSKGIGRFLPNSAANPAVGEIGKLEEVVEERIEVTCEQEQVSRIIKAIRANHPYEEPAIDVYPLLSEL